MWVTMSGNSIGHVWHATSTWSGQGPWIDMSGTGSTGLGNLVVDSVAVTSSAVVVGTDAGVMVCEGCLPPSITPPGWSPTPAWYSLGVGLPNAKVDALRLSSDGSLLAAWTHGRGVWTLPVQAIANLSATSIAFGDQTMTETGTQALTTTSTGLASLSFTAPAQITGPNAADFAIQPNACTPGYPNLLWGDTCSLHVTFTPSASGPRTATLSVYDNASGSPQIVSLTGNGVRPTVSLSPASLAFGDVGVQTYSQGSITVTNTTGPGNLDFQGVTVSGPNANNFVVIDKSTCPLTGGSLHPGTSCAFVVLGIVNSTGPMSATLNIADNSADSPHLVALSANGVVPSMTITPANVGLSFPNTTYGTTSPEQTVTFSNNGPGNLVVSGYVAGNAPNDFTISSNTCSNIFVAPGASCTIGVAFQPQDIGQRTASLAVYANDGGNPHNIALSGTGVGAKVIPPSGVAFGDGAVGVTRTQTIILQNTGNADLSGVILLVDGSPGQNPADFSAVGCSGSVAPNASCTITVSFSPSDRGDRTAFLKVSSTSPVVGMPFFVPLSGIGVHFNSVQPAPTLPTLSFHGRLAVPPPPRSGVQVRIPKQPLNNPARMASKPFVPASAPAPGPSAMQVIPAMEDLMARVTTFLCGF